MTRRNDWRVTTALFAITGLVESLAFGHFGVFTPLYLEQLRVPPGAITTWTGVLSAIGFVIGLPLLPLWGVWADRYGRKLIIIRSSVAGALMFGLAAVSPDVYWLAAARFLSGFVLGNTGVMMAVQADITPRGRLGTAVSLISGGSPVGVAAGPYLGGLLIKRAGIRALLGIDAGLTVLVALLLALVLREEPRPDVAPSSTRAGVGAALRAIAHTPQIRLLFSAAFLLAFGMTMNQPYVPLVVQRLYTGTPADLAPAIGAVATLSGVMMALFTPLWGPLADKAGHMRILRICAVVVGATLVMQALSTTLPGFRDWRAAQGAFQGGISSLVMVLLALYTPPANRSSVLTLSLLPQQVSWFLGPLAGSAAAARSLVLPFWLGAAVVLAGWTVSLALPRPPAQGTEPPPGNTL